MIVGSLQRDITSAVYFKQSVVPAVLRIVLKTSLKGISYKSQVDNTERIAELWVTCTLIVELIHSDEGLMLEMSAFRISVWWSIWIINSVDKTS